VSLPPELDFAKDREASPDRMNRAMTYILDRLRQAIAVKADYELAIEELRASGLQRLSEALQPVVANAYQLAGELEAVHGQWVADNAIVIMQAALSAEIAGRFDLIEADIDARLATAATAILAAQTRQDRADADRWFFNHG
jgi:hypothetical protein